MRKLSKDEVPEILPIRRGRGGLLRANLLQLEVGEALFLPKEEWKAKNGPFYVVSGIKKRFGYEYDYGLMIDKTGWLFKRIK